MPGAVFRVSPHKDSEPKAPPTRHSPVSTTLGEHSDFAHPDAPNAPSPVGGDGGSTIKITTEQLDSWADVFEKGATRLQQIAERMGDIHVEPGFFGEADTVRNLVSTFNGAFIPNMASLADAHQYVGRALRLSASTFNDAEHANLDKNTDLTDMIGSMTRGLTSLKPLPQVKPGVPTGGSGSTSLQAP